jgi:hypothetical protein
MNQSIDKLANLLLARKAIHSLPANTSLTLRELNALVLGSTASTTTANASSSPSTSKLTRAASQSSFSSIRNSTSGGTDEVYHNRRHPHQAPLSIMASSHGLQVTIRQLSSSSRKQ